MIFLFPIPSCLRGTDSDSLQLISFSIFRYKASTVGCRMVRLQRTSYTDCFCAQELSSGSGHCLSFTSVVHIKENQEWPGYALTIQKEDFHLLISFTSEHYKCSGLHKHTGLCYFLGRYTDTNSFSEDNLSTATYTQQI